MKYQPNPTAKINKVNDEITKGSLIVMDALITQNNGYCAPYLTEYFDKIQTLSITP
jgi:hypothetical protein